METQDGSSKAIGLDDKVPAGIINLPSSGLGLRTPSESPSEEDYDDAELKKVNDTLCRRSRRDVSDHPEVDISDHAVSDVDDGHPKNSSSSHETVSRPKLRSGAQGKKSYVVASDDTELREVLRRGLERVCASSIS